MASDSSQFLQQFVRHVPRTLCQQLLSQLVSQYMERTAKGGTVPNTNTLIGSSPCIARFNGALLFVDISGFTVLSQQLPVDELRVHINAYFKKILDLVFDHGGDVIKFAGDALYAVWKEDSKMPINSCVARALSCGVHINLQCANYKIMFNNKDRGSSQLSSILLGGVADESAVDFVGDVTMQERSDHAVLDVHTGLSTGTMAGIDVGSQDRWEFFVVGPPIQLVAAAEAEASKGEMVIDAASHLVACGGNSTNKEDIGRVLACGCLLTPGGAYKVDIHKASHQVKLEIDQREDEKDDIDLDYEMLNLVLEGAHDSFDRAKTVIMETYKALKAEKKDVRSPASPLSGRFGDVSDAEGEAVYGHFLTWVEACITDDLWKHVHEATRAEYTPHNMPRCGCVQMLLDQQTDKPASASRKSSASTPSTNGDANSSSQRRRSSTTSSSSSAEDSVKIRRQKSMSVRADILRERRQARHERARHTDSSLIGELRNVIVMFINIYMEAEDLLMENSEKGEAGCALRAFSFLPTTVAERESDLKLLGAYQCCIDTIIGALKSKGGQLRQFIVDDKGTVSIGTFGLRGSSGHDNAAAAVEAAHIIIGGLRELGISAAVGITSGKAYCGLVGSMRRHEYAVMGPSTNLSARLMASAKPGQVVCDQAIRKGDRLHTYRHVGDVKAKGYAHLVPTYKPTFIRGSMHSTDGGLEAIVASVSAPMSKQGTERLAVHQKPKKTVIIGREDFKRRVALFLLSPMLQGSPVADILRSDAQNPQLCVMHLVHSQPAVLSTQFRTRVAVVEGPSGIGKSAILDLYRDSMDALIAMGHLNAVVFRGTPSSFDATDPFKSWRPIIRGVLRHFAELGPSVEPAQEPSAETKDAGDVFLEMPNKISAGLAVVKGLLPEELQLHLPLISAANIIPGIAANDTTSSLSGTQKIAMVTSLLFEILQRFCVSANKVVVLLFDDAQFMDPSSWGLLTRLWSEGHGFLALATFAGKVEDGSENPLLTPALGLGESHSADAFGSCDRIFREELSPLDLPAVGALVDHVFRSEGYSIEDPEFHERILTATGGNPLYIYELSRAVMDKFVAANFANMPHRGTRGSVLTKSDTGALLKDFHTARVEEVIFYRFDMLPAQAQLLLKTASVACMSGSGFTVQMLVSVFSDSSNLEDSIAAFRSELYRELSVEEVVVLELDKLLRKEEFLRVTPNSRRGSMSFESFDGNGLQESVLSSAQQSLFGMEFEFKIMLECKTIYGLMLEDQRESIHDRVATFLEEENANKKEDSVLTPQDLFEEGFHWEKAAVWSTAMSCYHRSAMLLDALGAYQESFKRLTSGYRMLNELRKDAGILEDLSAELRSVTLQNVVDLARNMTEDPNYLRKVNVRAEIGLSKDDLARVFGDNSKLLDVGLQVTLRLAQAGFTLTGNATLASRLYEDALLMILLTWKYVSEGDEVVSHGSSNFGLEDPQIVFPILSGLAAIFRNRQLGPDPDNVNEGTMYGLIVALAETSPEFFVHRIQGMCLMHSLFSEKQNFSACRELARKIRATYSSTGHSSALVRWYGNDRVLFTLAKEAQNCWMYGGGISDCDEVVAYSLSLLPSITHLHSHAIGALPLASVLIANGQIARADSVFASYYALEQSRQGFSFFREINPLYAEFFRLRKGDARSTIGELNSIQEKVFNKEYFNQGSTRPLLYTVIHSIGISFETVCAEILMMLAAQWLEESSTVEAQQEAYAAVLKLLSVASEYAMLAMQEEQGDKRHAFSHAISAFSSASVAHSLSLMSTLQGDLLSPSLRSFADDSCASLRRLFDGSMSDGLYVVALRSLIYQTNFGCPGKVDQLARRNELMEALMKANLVHRGTEDGELGLTV